jgi:hypothetical protein
LLVLAALVVVFGFGGLSASNHGVRLLMVVHVMGFVAGTLLLLAVAAWLIGKLSSV